MTPSFERWRKIPTDPAYEVSDLGRVRRAARGQGARVGRILKHQRAGAGYHVVRLSHGRQHYVHRLVADAWLPMPLGASVVRFKGDDASDLRVENLEWAVGPTSRFHAARLKDAVGPTPFCVVDDEAKKRTGA